MSLFKWTPERVNRLRQLIDEGHSAAVIARDLGGGISRSAVIGKAYRLGISLPNSKSNRKALTAKPIQINIDKRFLTLLRKFPHANFYEISEATALGLRPFQEVCRLGLLVDPDRNIGSEDEYNPRLVSEMRAAVRVMAA